MPTEYKVEGYSYLLNDGAGFQLFNLWQVNFPKSQFPHLCKKNNGKHLLHIDYVPNIF